MTDKEISSWQLFREDLETYVGKGWLPIQVLKGMFSLKYRFLLNVRIAHFFARRRWLFIGPLLRRLCKIEMLIVFSSDIHCDAVWGRRVRIAHPLGIVVGAGVRIGDDCTLYQNVTLGARKHGEGKYPVLKEHVTIYAGACCIGGICIGVNSVVGANAVLRDSCGDNAVIISQAIVHYRSHTSKQ